MIKTNLEQFFSLTDDRKDIIKKLSSNLNFIFLMSILLLLSVITLIAIKQLSTVITIIAIIITLVLIFFYFITRMSISDTFRSQLNQEKRDYALKNFKLYYSFKDYLTLAALILIVIVLFITPIIDMINKLGA